MKEANLISTADTDDSCLGLFSIGIFSRLGARHGAVHLAHYVIGKVLAVVDGEAGRDDGYAAEGYHRIPDIFIY